MPPTAFFKPVAFTSPVRPLPLLPPPLPHGSRRPLRGGHHLSLAPLAEPISTVAVTGGQSTAKAELFTSARLQGLRTKARGAPRQQLPPVSRLLGRRKWASAAAASDGVAEGLGGDGAMEVEAAKSASSDRGGAGTNVGGRGQQEEEASSSSPGFLTLPTVLTLARVAAVPLLISMFYMDDRLATTATTSIFVAASITDWLDGYIARKMKLGTNFGAFLDPVADKLMVAATLVVLCTRPVEVAIFGKVPWLLTVPAIAIIGREITMSAVREWAASQDSKVLEAVAVNNLGKWKTATQMVSLTILLATRDSSLSGSGLLTASGVVLLYISSGLAVWSLAVYMKNIWRVLLK